MSCQRCSSDRILSISGKCSDCCTYSITNQNLTGDGYVPDNLNVGGGDYIEFTVCLDCGQQQGIWPVPPTEGEIRSPNPPKGTFGQRNVDPDSQR